MSEPDEFFYIIVDEFTGVEIDTHWFDNDNEFPVGKTYENSDVIGVVSTVVNETSHTRRVFIIEHD